MSWHRHAACLDADPALFFPSNADGNGRGVSTNGYIAEAKRICYGCPVRVPCLEEALANDEAHGVWGGTSPGERQKLRRQRRMAS